MRKRKGMVNWHPENLSRGRIYVFHVGMGQSVELVRMLFDEVRIIDRKLCVAGIDQRTGQDVSIQTKSVAEVQPLGG